MKKTYFTLAAIAVFAFAACNGKSGEAGHDSDSSKNKVAPPAEATTTTPMTHEDSMKAKHDDSVKAAAGTAAPAAAH